MDLELLISKLNANMGRVIDLFRAWDINENGEISKAEFRKGVIATLGITPSREELAALFAFLDPDGSGTIDYRELDAKLRRREVHHHPLINPEKPASKPASRRPSSSRPVPPLASLPQPVVAKTVAAITPRSAREWTTPGVASAPLQGRLGSDERVVGEALRTVAAGGGSPHKNYARAPSGSVAGERTVAEEIARAMEVGRERAAVRIQATRRSQNVRQTMSVLHAVVTVMQSQFRARKALAAYANDPRRVAARNVQKRVRGKRARREHGGGGGAHVGVAAPAGGEGDAGEDARPDGAAADAARDPRRSTPKGRGGRRDRRRAPSGEEHPADGREGAGGERVRRHLARAGGGGGREGSRRDL